MSWRHWIAPQWVLRFGSPPSRWRGISTSRFAKFTSPERHLPAQRFDQGWPRSKEARRRRSPGRPAAVLTTLVESSAAPLVVLGMPSAKRPPPERHYRHNLLGGASGVTSAAGGPTRTHNVEWPPPYPCAPRTAPVRLRTRLRWQSPTLNLSAMTTTPVHVFHDGTVPKLLGSTSARIQGMDQGVQGPLRRWSSEDGFEVRTGPASPGMQLVDMAAPRTF